MRTLVLASLLAVAAACDLSARQPAVLNDYDGDQQSDFAVYDRLTGYWTVRYSSNGSTFSQYWGYFNAIPCPGDFDGDGKVDLAVYDRENGAWHIRLSGTGQFRSHALGWVQAVPVPADYDGDDKDDVAVFHRSSGWWFILQSSNQALRTEVLGGVNSRPVPADYDGDYKADVAVYDRYSGDFFIDLSLTQQIWHQPFGTIESMPVPADYNGDGLTDIAVYNVKTAQWKIYQSGVWTIRLATWGSGSVTPVPGDYDKDGKDDLATYNPASAQWDAQLSQTLFRWLLNYGSAGNRAVASFRFGALDGLKVLAFGDSITYGDGSSSESPATGYPILLERILEGGFGGDIVSINAGNPGETTSGGLSRLPLTLLATVPDVLLLMEGTNDHFGGDPYDEIESNLRAMVGWGQTFGAYVVLATIPPVISNEYRDRSVQQSRIVGFNPRIYNIGFSMGIPIAQVYEAITSVPGWEENLMDQPSANHPNDAGYLKVREAFNTALSPALANGTVY